MRLRIGDKVVHPLHGAGIVKDMRSITLNGVTRDLYIVEIPHTKQQVFLPTTEVDAHPLRRVISAEGLPALAEVLAAGPQPLPEKSSFRFTWCSAHLRFAQPLALAELVRDLSAILRANDRPRVGDQQVWERARELLCAEWALAADISFEAAETRINRALTEGANHRRKIIKVAKR